MKPALHHLACLAFLGLISPPISKVHASPPPPDSLHFCQVLDLGLEDLDIHPAGKRLGDLNAGEPRTVRMLYFVPNDRPVREEIIQKMKDEIRGIQTFFGEQMQAHGYGYKTFRYETDDEGEPLVHRLRGVYPDSHYVEDTFLKLKEEIDQIFDPYIQILVVDNASGLLSGYALGRALVFSKQRGTGVVTAGGAWRTTAHELGHAFGLQHNFQKSTYIMSYGSHGPALSACAAAYLAVHPYFDPEVGLEEGQPPAIELISSRAYPAGSESVPVRLRVSDADGLHLVKMFVLTHDPGIELKTCQGLTGEKETVVELAYDGVVPGDVTCCPTDLSDPPVHPIYIAATDKNGDDGWLSFDLWEISPSHVSTLEAGHVHSLAFSPDGTLASASGGVLAYPRAGPHREIRLWDIDRQTAITLSGRANDLALSPGSTTLAAASRDIALWNAETGQFLASLPGPGSHARSVAFSPDGTVLAAAYPDEIRLWDMDTHTRTATLPAGATVVAVSANGILASADRFEQITLWDMETLTSTAVETATSTHGWGPDVKALAFSPDGSMFASGAFSSRVQLWNAYTGESVSVLGVHYGAPVSSVVFSPDGSLLASGAPGSGVLLWDVGRGRGPVALRAPTKAVNALAFSPDGRFLAAGSDGTIELWDMAEWLQPRPTRLVVVSGDTQEGPAGAQLDDPLVLEVRDQYDNPLPGVRVTFTVTDGDGHFVDRYHLNRRWTDANGRVEITLTLGPEPGTNTVEARAGLRVVTFSATGRLVLPHPKSLTRLSGAEQDGRPGLALDEPLVIEVRDQNGAWLRDVEVTFAITSGDGTLSVESTTTNPRGQASTTLTLGNAPGPTTVEVTVAGVDPVTFTATTLAVPWTLTRVGGLEQEGPAGEPLQSPLVVSVLDQTGAPLAGTVVAFVVTTGEGTLSVSTANTDADGLASTTLTLGPQPGANTVVATVAGLDPVTFGAMGRAVPRTLTKVSGDLQHGTVGTRLADSLVVSVRDQTGSPLPGAPVTFTLTDGQGTLSSTSDTTDAEGLASITLTLGGEPGASAVEVAVADLEPVTFTATARPSPDFDGDGVTGFEDFLLFAEAFGGGDPRFDLDNSGLVDFADFFLFAESFGQPARAKLLALARERIGLPDGPQLQQNAPNPFNSQTVIPWFLLQEGRARLEVYALTGQRVAVLHEGPHKAGFHQRYWDGRDAHGRPLASGVYLYRLVTSQGVHTRKLTLLR